MTSMQEIRKAAQEYIDVQGAVDEDHRYCFSKAMAEDILLLTQDPDVDWPDLAQQLLYANDRVEFLKDAVRQKDVHERNASALSAKFAESERRVKELEEEHDQLERLRYEAATAIEKVREAPSVLADLDGEFRRWIREDVVEDALHPQPTESEE